MSKTVHLHLTPELLHSLETLVEKGQYASVTEALRTGLRLILKEYGRQ